MTTGRQRLVIVHAGFHKTGTSSLQDHLRRNRQLLSGHVRLLLKEDMPAPAGAAVAYGRAPAPWRMRAFRGALTGALSVLPDEPVPLVLSWEGLSGAMPGHRTVLGRTIRTYRAAAPLALATYEGLHRRFPDADIRFLYTTRDQAGWTASVHGHILRSRRLTEDEATFRDSIAPLATSLAILRRRLPCDVIEAPLAASHDHRDGPAAPLLDLLDLPPSLRRALHPATHSNRGNSPEVRAGLADLNHRISDKAELRRAKAVLTGERDG
ncbi:hypothetical protein [Pelagovum pacificum]|uniref:Sulfotransferase family protein n=1 Tax=Pelagovum pacificum TaxID=2588711 RepID=A0A5C5GH76_9RHOB|nr:hypothetical protein [Pelagovum pacificum]QQA43425.1 hypothetical protein I8N54_02295 [Pelagovum pacificum]TNY33437.1 hypothetical protein FHY64_09235 [Pelagovum pacificum]